MQLFMKDGTGLILPTTSFCQPLPCCSTSPYTLMRASMLEQYGQDYVVTARAKGLTERRITFALCCATHYCQWSRWLVCRLVRSLVAGDCGISFCLAGLGMLAFESLFARDLNLQLGIFYCPPFLWWQLTSLWISFTASDPRIEVN